MPLIYLKDYFLLISRIYLANFSQKFRCFAKSRKICGRIAHFRDGEGRCGRYCLLLETDAYIKLASLTIPHKHCVFSVSLCIFKNPRLAVFLHSILACFYRQFFALKNLIWRCIEVVVTRTIRNRFVLNRARGFESHHLRQGSLEAFAPKEFFFFSRAPSRLPKH